MSQSPSETRTAPSDDSHVVARLSTVDRFLPLWIGLAMAAGLLLGRLIPGLANWLNAVSIHGTSLPIAIGLLLMMYPVLAKVRYREIGRVTADGRMIAVSLILNWIIGPAVMFALAWLLLPDLPAYRTGVILVGLARCIAMVLIWTDLACGDREMAAVLVALNAVFQVLAYAGLGVFYLNVLPARLDLPTQSLHVSFAAIAVTVVVFLGIPLVAGFLTRTLGERARGQEWLRDHAAATHCADCLVWAAFHRGRTFCAAGQDDHLPATQRRPDRAAAAGLLRRDVDRWLRHRTMATAVLPPHGSTSVLRGQQRL
jgi:arsenite transporter